MPGSAGSCHLWRNRSRSPAPPVPLGELWTATRPGIIPTPAARAGIGCIACSVRCPGVWSFIFSNVEVLLCGANKAQRFIGATGCLFSDLHQLHLSCGTSGKPHDLWYLVLLFIEMEITLAPTSQGCWKYKVNTYLSTL